MNIFVGNLALTPASRTCTTQEAMEKNVRKLFEAYGEVSAVNLKIKTGKNSRGFGFVTMPDESQAQAAILGLEEKDYFGRPLNISAERPKPVKPKKDYKEIKRLRQEAKGKIAAPVFEAPTIPEKIIDDPKAFKEVKEVKPKRKVAEEAKRFAEPTGSQAWTKRKGRGTAKPWKKKPGGVNKKFKYSR